MSLNRYEQILFNYIESRADERRFWVSRVEDIGSRSGTLTGAANDLNAMLWDYFEERSRFESPFREVVIREGMERISMINLAEYLLRVWAGLPKDTSKRGSKRRS